MQETQVWSLGWEDLLEKGMASHFSILTLRIPWTEEPGGLQSMGSRRVEHDWVTNTFTSYIVMIVFLMLKILQIYSLSNFQIYSSIILLTTTHMW